MNQTPTAPVRPLVRDCHNLATYTLIAFMAIAFAICFAALLFGEEGGFDAWTLGTMSLIAALSAFTLAQRERTRRLSSSLLHARGLDVIAFWNHPVSPAKKAPEGSVSEPRTPDPDDLQHELLRIAGELRALGAFSFADEIDQGRRNILASSELAVEEWR